MKHFLFGVSLVGLCACNSVQPKRESLAAYPIRVESVSEQPVLAQPANIEPSIDAQAQPDLHAAFERPTGMHWNKGEVALQGFLGWTAFSEVSIGEGNGTSIDGDQGDVDQMPLIGGGGQFKLGGDRVDWGLEAMFSFGGRANASAFVVGGGGAAVAVDVDLLLFDLYGGPFVSMFLGDKVRVYGAAGPLLQWVNFDQSDNTYGDDGSGFGTGWYARGGVEFAISSTTMIGVGARYSESEIGLDHSLGDLNIEGFEYMFTVTQGF